MPRALPHAPTRALPLALPRTLLGAVVCAGPLAACGSSTLEVQIERDDGALLVGEPIGGDAEHVWVYEPRTAQRVVVPRARITDIEGGGGARIWLGGAFIGWGALMLTGGIVAIASAEAAAEGESSSANGLAALLGLAGAITGLGIGLPILNAGRAQRAAAEAALSPEAGPPPDPPTTLYLAPNGLTVTF